MSVFDVLSPTEPSAQQGAHRIKQTLAHSFRQLEVSLAQVRQIVQRHGRANINSALGNEQTEVTNLYGALKSLVEEHKPGANIPNLPS